MALQSGHSISISKVQVSEGGGVGAKPGVGSGVGLEVAGVNVVGVNVVGVNVVGVNVVGPVVGDVVPALIGGVETSWS